MQLEESKAQANALQLELLAAYKERTLAAEARSLALEQLEIVRDNYAKQTAELESSREEENMLKSELFRSKEHANTMEKAKDIAVKELRAREAEIHASHSRAAALEDENKDLVDRILKMKDEEAQRLNEMNRLREDIVRILLLRLACFIHAAICPVILIENIKAQYNYLRIVSQYSLHLP